MENPKLPTVMIENGGSDLIAGPIASLLIEKYRQKIN
jgi:hypothetical protein